MTSPGAWTTVPEVLDGLVDTIIPAAIAALPSTITVAGEILTVEPPSVFWGEPDRTPAPLPLILVDDQVQAAHDIAVLPNNPGGLTDDEAYEVPIYIWVKAGDQGANAQRYASHLAYTYFRALAAAVKADRTIGGALRAPTLVYVKRVDGRGDKVPQVGRVGIVNAALYVLARV